MSTLKQYFPHISRLAQTSMIYHVSGQRGHRMNSSNAVYFNTEAEAQAAGYRRSLR